jgi:KDO2-lipid IV(A) lauroyltransferase
LEGKKNWNMVWLPGARATMYLLAHVGSFEVMAAVSRFLGVKGKLIVTGVPNRFVNRRMIFERGGQKSGLDILPHRGVVRHAVESLRNGEMLYVLADQRGDDTRPIWVDYFGRRVLANGVFAKLAMEGRASVYPALAVRTEDYRYKCIFGEEIPVQVSEDPNQDLTVNSQRFHNVFEEWLREYPEQGFWMHRKFGRKPKRRRKMNRISAWWRHRAKHAE